MKKNNISIILVLSIIISFISGALGSIIIYTTSTNDTGTTIIKTNNDVTLKEDNSISKGVANVYDAVVVVEGFTKEQLVSTGTGFVYKQNNDKAYIMTNHHVIAGVESVKIILSDNSVIDAKIMGSEAYSDIAVLSVDANKIKSIAIMGDSTKLNVGDTLFTVGSPEGSNYAGTVTKGILSGKDRLVAVALSSNTNSDYYMNESINDTIAHTYIIVGSKEQRKMIVSANMLHKAIKNSQMKIIEGYYHGEMSMNHAKEYVNLLEKFMGKSDGTERVGYEEKDKF